MKKADKQAIAAEVKTQIEVLGYQAMYGGRKGHGFWIKGLTLSNPRSGNPNFATMRECQDAIKRGGFAHLLTGDR